MGRTPVATPLQARSSDRKVLTVESEHDEDIVMLTEKVESMSLTGSGRGMKSRGRVVKATLPGKVLYFPSMSRRILFTSSAGFTGNVSVGKLINCFGAIATTTSNSFAVNTAVRLKKIRIWPSSNASGVSQGFVFWAGGSGNIPDQEEDVAIPEGITETHALDFVPPKASLAAFWWSVTDATTVLFQLGLGAAFVVELLCDVTQAVNLTTLANTGGAAGLTTGSMYYGSLDGSGVVLPIGLPSHVL